MNKIKILLLFAMYFIVSSCDEMGSTTNNYYSELEEQDTDTDWANDPLIGGTEITDTTCIKWNIKTIHDEQGVLCEEGNEDSWSCSGYLESRAEMDNELHFNKDGSFTYFKRGPDGGGDGGTIVLGSGLGTWKTMNGLIEINFSESSSMNSVANYLFHNRTYNYETIVGSSMLRLFDEQTEIFLETGDDGY